MDEIFQDNGPAILTARERPVDPAARECLMCHRPLGKGERRVHHGACQRKRKTVLQRLARWRRRR